MAIVAVTGASGFIGRALTQALRARGDRVRPLVRPGRTGAPDAIAWDPEAGELDVAALSGVDALVHLAGENLAGARWTEAQKARLRESRVRGTSLLARALRELPRKPAVWLSASAIGYYGDRGSEELDESSSPGADFLSEMCVAWEAAAAPAAEVGVRLVHPRTGVVLAPHGGALAKMLTPFKLGVGGKLGSGTQYMSWIGLDDAVRGLLHMLDYPKLVGPVNLTAPHPVTNAAFTQTLARALRRPAWFGVPGLAARIALGEMADAALLHGQRVLPKRLLASGFDFAYPELESLLEHLLRPRP